ncbi:MAG: TrkA family potassium uptake protein [Halobacteriaceae archaeon]
MTSWGRRTVLYLGGMAATMALFTLLYAHGMAAYEGDPITLLHALQVVVETFTTTGFGSDAPWTSAEMNVLVIVMDLVGTGLIFLLLPVYVFPLFEEMLTASVPTSVDREDHVVICGFSPRDEHLVEELDTRDVPVVVALDDEERARDLQETGHTVVLGDTESTDTMAGACVPDARAVVLDVGDESNAATALTVREVAPEVRVVSYVEDPENREYVEYAGADEVISPRTVLGEGIAGKVTSGVSADLDAVEVGEDFEIVELPVQSGSALDGAPLASSEMDRFTGVSVIGAWVDGEFIPNPAPERRIDRSTVLLLAGSRDQLSALAELARSPEHRPRPETVIIAGHGEVGGTVRSAVEDAGVETTVIDLTDDPGVDVVGDATNAAALRRAGIEDAGALILALGDDTTTVFATLVASEIEPDVEIISRADAVESVSKLYAAGADYVLALATVSGRMLAAAILDEDVMSLETNIEIVRTKAPALAGSTLAEADVRSRTGVTVIAVERAADVITDLPPDFRIEAEDALIVAGTDEDVRDFADVAEAGEE